MAEAITIARPYAKAIFELAEEKKALKEWSKMLKTLAMIAADKNMQPVLKNPLITTDQLTSLFFDVASGTLNEEAEHLIEMLATNKRLNLLPAITKIYEQYLADAERIIDVKVVSAYPIDSTRLKKLEQALQGYLNRKVTLHMRTDSALLGGAVIYAGDRVIDGSLRGKLNQLSERLCS
jgi:F-type H+-transporting ATPase subunit delta